MRKYIPKVGNIFKDREELVGRLEKSGWKFEGWETEVSSRTGKIIGYNIGVVDDSRWLMVELDSLLKGVRVTTVRFIGEGWKKTPPKPRRYIPIRGLDLEIKDLIKILNEAGYITEYSCAGHGGVRGFINFQRTYFTKDELEDLREIFRQYNIRRVTFHTKEKLTRATFPRVG